MMTPSFSLPKHILCGLYDSAFIKTEQTPLRVVTQYELEFFTFGGGVRYVDGERIPIKAGDLYLTRPGARSFSKLPFRTLYVKFDADGSLAETLNRCGRWITPKEGDRINTLFSELLSLYEMDGYADFHFYERLFVLLEAVVAEFEEGTAELPENKAVADAARFISAHLSEPISLADIARAAHLSPGYLHSRFKMLYGMSPRAYTRKKRVEKAKRMLESGTLSASDIAIHCGFGTQQYFSKVFSEATGMTPKKYRESLWKGYLI